MKQNINENIFEDRIQKNQNSVSQLNTKIKEDLYFNDSIQSRAQKNAQIQEITEEENVNEPKSKVKWVVLAIVAIIIIALGILGYIWYDGYNKYDHKFIAQTYINDVAVDKLKVNEVEQILENQTKSKELNLTLPDKKVVKISYLKLGAKYDYNDQIQEILNKQNRTMWFWTKKEEHNLTPIVTFDKEIAKNELSNRLANHIPEVNFSQAVNYDIKKGEFSINKNVNTMNYSKEELVNKVVSELNEQKSEINLSTLGKAEEKLTKLVEDANTSLKSSIKIKFGDKEEVIERSHFINWLGVSKEGIQIDINSLGAYIANLSKKYAHDTDKEHITYDTRLLGNEIAEEIKNGRTKDFTAKELKVEIVKEDTTPDAKYPFCASHKDGTFVEINKSTQTLCAYIDGSVKYGANVVTGDHSKGRDTPNGTWKIWNKSMNKVLDGSTVGSGNDYNYKIPVKYWMPIDNTGVGLHSIDADEVTGAHGRVNWSPSAYLNGAGSHGCVNMHTPDAKWIYENMPLNSKVVVF